MYDDGICDLGNNRYSATWSFEDTNYSNTEKEARYATFEKYCEFLNAFDETTFFQIHINSKQLSRSSIDLTIHAPMEASEELRLCVEEYNDYMLRRYNSDNSYIQEKSVTITIAESSYDAARKRFEIIDSDKLELLRSIGCMTKRLDKIHRLIQLREIYRPDDRSVISYDSMASTGVIDKDLIAPYSIDTSSADIVKLGDYFTQTLFLTDFPQDLSDELIRDITSIDEKILLTINVTPQNPREAIKAVKKRLDRLEREKEDVLERKAKMGIKEPKPPRELKKAIERTENLLNELDTRNEKMFLTNILVLIRAESLDELEAIKEKILDKVAKSGCDIRPFTFGQEDGLNSVLPLGRNDTFIKRILTTTSLAAFIPFNVVEIVHENGLSYGKNRLSHNIILMDRNRYENAHGFYFGTSGSGKSTLSKLEVWECFFRTNDDIIIIDPEGEFTKLVNLLGGQVIDVSTASPTRFNPLDINQFYGGDDEPDPIPFKSDFIISLIEETMQYHDGIDMITRSVADRCVRLAYHDYKLHPCLKTIPTFTDFYGYLKEQPEKEAKQLASGLEIFIEGTLNIFAEKSNVNTDNRILCFNTKRLGKQLKTMGMSIIQDYCWNQISKNQELNKCTRLWNDEIHLSLKNESTADWLINSWKRGRKYGLIATGMTQEVGDVLQSSTSRALISNSEFVLLFRQKNAMLKDLTQVMDLSDQQINRLLTCDKGCGLFKAGNSIVEFNNKFDTSLKLFEYLKTDVHKDNDLSGDQGA